MTTPVAKRPSISKPLFDWIKVRDPNELALRRAARTAVVMSALFAFCIEIIGSAEIATFAAFGSIALLMLVDFSGPMRARIQAEIWLSVTGAALVCLGTLTSQTVWLSVLSMAVVAIVVLFVGVVSSVLASATTSLLLVFILSTAVAGAPSTIPDRLAGWGLASLASLIALWILWPSPNRNPLRLSAAYACRALSARLNADVAHWRDDGSLNDGAYETAIEGADVATEALHRGFLSAQWRPTGLSVSSRATVRLVDEVLWLDTLVDQAGRPAEQSTAHEHDCRIRSTCAAVLDVGAGVLEDPAQSSSQLTTVREELSVALEELVKAATTRAPFASSGDRSSSSEGAALEPERVVEISGFVDSLEPSFRAQEIGFVTSLIGANIDLAATADRRGWLDSLVGMMPGDASGRWGAARERALTHLNRHSVWLHNSVRGAIGLSVAVLIAEETGVQHAFWVILGTLSVLRSNAINTGANALRALLGTAIGFILGAALLVAVGTNVTILWILLPIAILFAGFAPTAISFAAGQAVSRLLSSFFGTSFSPSAGEWALQNRGHRHRLRRQHRSWPFLLAARSRGGSRRHATRGVRNLGRVPRGGRQPSHARQRQGRRVPFAASDGTCGGRGRVAASRRRFSHVPGQRGSKPVPLAAVTTLVRGVVSLRQTAEAVFDLWPDGPTLGDTSHPRARSELYDEARLIERWYDDFGAALVGERTMPEPTVESSTFNELIVNNVDAELRASDADTSSRRPADLDEGLPRRYRPTRGGPG